MEQAVSYLQQVYAPSNWGCVIAQWKDKTFLVAVAASIQVREIDWNFYCYCS